PLVLGGGSPSSGIYSGTGVSSGIFDPNVAGEGTHLITYFYVDVYGCNDSAFSSITVNPKPIVSLSGFPSLCLGSAPLVLGGGSPSSGIYSGTGVSSGIFDPNVAGEGTHLITYSYTDANGCSNSALSTITVNPLPVANAGASTTICGGNIVPIGATAVVGSTYQWISNPIGFTSTMANPSVSPVVTTTYTVTETVTATGCAKSNDVTVIVADAENPTIVCAPDVTINTTPGLSTGTTVLINPTISDNCTNSFGNALNFDGLNDHISIANTNLPAGNSPRTFTVWIKTTQTGTIGDIISYGNGANGENFNVGILGGSIFVSSWADPQYFVPASNVNNGSWHHVAVSYDGTNAQTYVDGILLDDRAFAINTVLNTAKIGARRDALFEFFEGSIDELSIWNIALTQGQIQANMNSELGIQPGLVALYHFNQGVAGVTNTGLTTVADTSANSNNGTLNGFALTGSASNWVLGNVVGGELSVTNDAPNEYPIGNTTVTWTATDASNNTATCTQKVTVVDTENPTIVCAPDVTINTTPGLSTGITTLINPTVSDNCCTVGNALSFDGGYVDVPHNDLLNPIDQLTIETWVKRISNGLQESLIEKYANQADTFGYLLRITDANKAFTMVLNASNQGVELTGSTTILPNVWYHLAATFNRNTGVLKLYVNGVLDGQITGISGLPTTPGAQSLKIGARGDDAATRLINGGVIDEARVWNIERTQAQIQTDMNRELSAQTGLVALYHFNQGIVGGANTELATAMDDSGNGFNGTLNGFALTGSTSNWVLGNVVGGELSVTNDAPNEYPIGNTTVTWTATDASNNTGTCTQKVTVVDTENPTIVCPSDVTINTTAGLCTGTTLLVSPAVSDNSINSFGNALNFDGGYVDVPHNDLLNPINQLTIETWVKITSGGKSLIEKYSYYGNDFGYLLRISPENKAFTMVLKPCCGGPQLTGATTILPNEWYHLAVTFNRTTGVLKLYVNGVLDGQINGITDLPENPGTLSLKIGARGDDAAIYSNGDLMDEVRIWNVERTQSQIQADMNKELSAQAGLVALYHFNQGIAGGNNSASPGPAINTAIDDSGNGFNGTLNGFTLTGATSNWVLGNTIGGELNVINDAPETYPIGNTTVTWTATDASNNTATCTQKVTVVDNQQLANAGVSSSICSGNSVALGTATVAGHTYSWVSNPSGFASTVANPSVSPIVTTTYTLTETVTATGCSKSNEVTITVNPLPVANAGASIVICRGNSIVIGATAVSGNTYSWVSNPAGFTSTVSNPSVSPTVTTSYTLTETIIATGCSKSNSATVTVNPLPVVTLNAFSPVCISATAFTLTGGLPTGGIYAGTGVSSGIFNPSVAGVGVHPITYSYTNINGCTNLATANIQVNGPIANAGADATIYIGYTQTKCVTLSGSATGGLPPYKYLWSTGSKNTSISVCPTVKTTYTLKITDAQGCFQSDDVVVNTVDITCAKNSVYICHNGVTQCVKTTDVKTHLAHGDYLGSCINTARFASNTDFYVVENSDTFVIYPNPTTGSFTVEVNKKDVVEGAMIQVLDFNGRIIYSKAPFVIDGHMKETIELNDALPVGVYFVNLIVGENVETKKLILKE
ncbi:LamG-like jellyroll fold domain-containing protein, partial [Flavobacterium laiguense]